MVFQMRVNLTERFAKSATAQGRKSPISYDDEVIGFGLQVRDNGRKTFTLDYTFEGRRRRYFIAPIRPGALLPPAANPSGRSARSMPAVIRWRSGDERRGS